MKKVTSSLLLVFALMPFLYVAIPLLHLLLQATPHNVVSFAHNQELRRAIGTSLLSAGLTTLLSLIFGLPAAFLLAIKSFPGKRLLETLFLLPLVMPPIVGGIAQMDIYGPQTWLGGWFYNHGIALTNTFIGVVLAQSFITSPFLIFSAKAGFEEIPKELSEATKILGGNWSEHFLYVSLPLARQAILAGALLTFARALGEFGATMIMAYHPYTIPVDIWVQFTAGGLQDIIPMAALIVLFAFLVSLLSSVPWGKRRHENQPGNH